MSKHISGKDFDSMLGDLLIHFESMSATITDNRKAVMTKGVPDGHVDGDVACEGDFEVDTKNFNLIVEAAKAAGSFHDLEPMDVTTVAKTSGSEHKQELFGCLLSVTDLLNIDPNGSDKTKHKIGFSVTSPDFVRINGVPYLSERETETL